MEPTKFLSGIYKGPLQINKVKALIKKMNKRIKQALYKRDYPVHAVYDVYRNI